MGGTPQPRDARRVWLQAALAHGFVLLFAAWVLGYAAIIAGLGTPPYDGDSLMRLQQVRDLLAGQSWFDVTQHRMDPPAGAAMHWSRLVDMPLAAIQIVLRPLLGTAAAEHAASVAVPLAYLAAAQALLRAIMLRLGLTRGEALAGAALAPLFPQLPAAFAPMQIDHHAPQALGALAVSALLIHPARRTAATVAGAVAGGWTVISLEGLPLVALAAALFGMDYVRRSGAGLAWFLGTLAVSSATLSLATRPLREFALYCDILLPAHWAVFLLGAGLVALLRVLPGQRTAQGRLASLAAVAAVCGAAALLLLGDCSRSPFEELDPLVGRYWFDTVGEGLPLWHQPWPTALIAAHAALLVPAGVWAAYRRGLGLGPWVLLAAYAGGAALYGLVVLRETMQAQLLAVPFAAALLAVLWPRARAIRAAPLRIAASVAVLLVATPAAAALVGPLLLAKPLAQTSPSTPPPVGAPRAPCDFAQLAALPHGLTATTYNAAPAVLVLGGQPSSIGGYHRNAAALHRSIAIFTGSLEGAKRLLARQGARHLAVCLDDASLAVMAQSGPDSLAGRLLSGHQPDWLVPVPEFAGSRLLVFRVTSSRESYVPGLTER